jgi:hypothetical protein
VGVYVGVYVGVFVGVYVGVYVGVFVGVYVGVFVGVSVDVFVGVSVGVAVAAAQTTGVMRLSISVTAPSLDWPSAQSLPATFAWVSSEMSWAAIMVPTNAELSPRVAEVPTRQNTLQPGAEPPLVTTTDELDAVMSVLAILKTQTALGSPCASRVRVPVIPADDAKQ